MPHENTDKIFEWRRARCSHPSTHTLQDHSISKSKRNITECIFIPIKVSALQSQSHQSPDVIRDAQRQVDDDHYDGSFEFVDQDGHQSRLQTNDTRGLKFRCQLTQVHIYNSAQMLQTWKM